MPHTARRKTLRALVASAAVGAACLTLVAPAVAYDAANPAFPTYDHTVTDVPEELGSDIAGSAFVDGDDGQFHWSNSEAPYSYTDDGTSWEHTFTNDDWGAVQRGIADGSTTLTSANAQFNTPGTLCYRLGDRKDAQGRSIMPSPYNDDHCDIVGVWVDPQTKRWYAAVNDEFIFDPANGDPNETEEQRLATWWHSNRILLATSDDKGKSWQIQNEIVTPAYEPTDYFRPEDYPGTTIGFGNSGVRFYVDYSTGYFYIFYNFAVRLKNSQFTRVAQWDALARAPISGKMARGTWNKYYDGGWSQPGIGGLEGSIDDQMGLKPSYIPQKDQIDWRGVGKTGRSLDYRSHLLTVEGPTFPVVTPSGATYTADANTGAITDASGQTVPSVSYVDPDQGATIRLETTAKNATTNQLTLSTTDPSGHVRSVNLTKSSTIFKDTTTGLLYQEQANLEPAFSFNMYSRTYQIYGYDGYVYQTDDLGHPGHWTPVAYATAPALYQTTLDYGSLTNQSVTARSFWAISDGYAIQSAVKATDPTAGQTSYAKERWPVDAKGRPVDQASTYTLDVGGRSLGRPGADRWQLVPVKDSYLTTSDSGAYRLRNVATGEYLDVEGSTVQAKRRWGAALGTGPAEPEFDPSGNDGYGSPGGSDQWYVLSVASDHPRTIGPRSSGAEVAQATDTSIGGSRRYVLVNRNSNLAVQFVHGEPVLEQIGFGSDAQRLTLGPVD